ncbi:tape measure protein [Moraxella osloensis]|nr:tape measure protein [Moraxella osloensis]MBW4008558.1 tape measure protein [Moraxella osloensis]
MASGLSIVIDTRNAELNIKNLNQALERLETQGNSIANMMRNLGSNNPFAALTASINVTKSDFNALAASANMVKTTTKEMGDALVYAKTTLTGAATAATTFQAAMRGVGNSLNTAQAAMARFNQSGQSIANVLNSLNGANGSNGVNNLNNAIKQLNPNVAALNAEFKAVNGTLNSFTTAANKADAAALRLNTTLNATRTNLTGLATANASVNASIGNLGNVLNNLQTRLAGLGTTLNGLNANLRNLPPLNNAAASSANRAAASTSLFQRNAQGLEATLMRLQSLMMGGIFGMAALSVLKTADAMQTLDNQVRIVTKSTEERLAVENEVHRIANANYTDIKTTTDIYHRNALAMASMGASQKDVLRFTENMSLAMRTSGRTITEQNSALYQWSQAMGAGKLQGQEFRIIALAVPSLLKYISAEMGVTTGQLKKLGAEGKITGEVMVKAVEKARPELEKLASQMPMTMSQAFTVANNEYKLFIDKIMNGTGGASQTIASMIYGIGKNFDTIIKGMTIAGGLAFVAFASKIDIATKSMALFNFVANANPFVRMATIILAVSSAFYGLDDVINTTSVIMGDLIHMITDGWTGIFNLIGDGLNSLQGVVAQNNDDIGKSYKDMFTNATTDHDKFIANATFASNNLVKTISADNMKNERSFFGFYEKSQTGFIGFVEFMLNGVGLLVAGFASFFKWTVENFKQLDKHFENVKIDISNTSNSVIGWAKDLFGIQHKPVERKEHVAIVGGDPREITAEFTRMITEWVRTGTSSIAARSVPQAVTGGMPPSLYAPIDPNAKPPSTSDDKDGKKKKKDDLQIQVFNAWKNAGLSAQQAMLLTAEVGRENAYNAKVLFGYHKDANNGKLNVGMLSWQGSRATDLSKYLAAAGVLKNGKIEKSQESLNAMAQFAVKEMMSNPAYAKTKTVFLANKEIDTNTGFNVLGRDYIRWDMDGRKINANTHKARRNNYYTQIQAKVGDKDLVSNFMEQTKAHDDYVNSIATGEAKIRAELAKTIESLPKKGFSGQALEDEKKRLTEEARFDIDLFRETNRQKLDELMGVHKTKKQQILDEATLQSLTIAADESKSREQRKTELEALDVGTKEKIRLNDIANKHELNQIYAYRKTSSELIADEWDEKIDALRQYTGEYKEEWRKAYEEQKQRALDADKLQLNQQLLSLNEYKYSSFAFIDERLKLELEAIAQSTDAEILKQAKIVDAKKKAEKDKKDAEAKQRATQSGLNSDLFGSDNAAFRMDDELLTNNLNRDDRLNMAADKYMNGQSSYADYLKQFEDITLAHTLRQRQIWLDGYGGMFGELTSIVGAFAGEQSKAYRVMFAIEKSFAIAKAALNIQAALASAEASMPFPANLPVIARVITEGAAIASNIKAINPKGFSTGGYTGNMGVNDIAGVVHGKEYVLNAAATKRIGVDNLNAMNKGASIGNNNVSVNVVVNADGSSDVQANAQMGKQMGDAIKAAVLQTIVQEKRQGGLLAR